MKITARGVLAAGFIAAGFAVSVAAAAQPGPESAPPAARTQPDLTVDSLSVVKVKSKAVANARTNRSLGPQREGTGVVIDSDGLVLTIGYLIVEAETQIGAGPMNLTIRHNTALITDEGGTAFSENSSAPADRFDFRDNLLSRGDSGFAGTGENEGLSTLNRYYTNYTFIKNAIISAPSGSYPANNFFPANTVAIEFVNFADGNYRLSASSPLKNQASDGTDVGADIDAVEAATAGVIKLF